MTGEDWELEWRNKSTPPYEVLHMVRNWDSSWIVYYRGYSRAAYNYVFASDELSAFAEGIKLMQHLRAKADYERSRRNRLQKTEKE
jgi:hypothetical protein